MQELHKKFLATKIGGQAPFKCRFFGRI